MSQQDDDMPTAPFWMTTFSDMMTLLLVMFVMIVSMSKVEVKKFKEALSYFQGSTGLLNDRSISNAIPLPSQTFRSREQARRYEELQQHIKEKGLADKVKVNLTEEGIHTVITDSVMFETGRAELIEPARTVLRLLAGFLDKDVQWVAVEGHTDSRPIRTSKYPSNWELSAARASTVVRFLQDNEEVLDPARYVAIGYGEYHPVTTNATAEGRARNRRVEIFFSWKPWPNKNRPSLKTLPTPTSRPRKTPTAEHPPGPGSS